jgi:hypothetical protein
MSLISVSGLPMIFPKEPPEPFMSEIVILRTKDFGGGCPFRAGLKMQTGVSASNAAAKKNA